MPKRRPKKGKPRNRGRSRNNSSSNINNNNNYAGRTEEEWRDWGENFGKKMARQGKDVAEEMEQLADKIGKHVESQRNGREWRARERERGKERERERGRGRVWGWWSSTFGVLGPILGAICWIVLIIIGISILGWINAHLGSLFITGIINFLNANIHWIFVFYLFFGYSKFLAMVRPREFRILSPVVTGLSVVIALWIIAGILGTFATLATNEGAGMAAGWIFANLVGILVAAIILGYLVLIAIRTYRERNNK